VVNSPEHTLFKPLHPVFDLAILDRFHTFLPGWEIPKNKDENLTRHYGLIIEYLAEAFHHLARQTNRFAQVKAACKLGPGYDQRDQTAVLKTVCAFVKLLHPGDEPTQEQVDEYLEYAIEGRRRVKEQLNKVKPDDEFASINLGYYDPAGILVTVYCPESREAAATQHPFRAPALEPGEVTQPTTRPQPQTSAAPPSASPVAAATSPDPEPVPVIATPREPKERSYRIHYGAIGHSYESIFGAYLPGAEEIVIEDPYIRQHHQINNFLRFCETAIRIGKPKKITLVTRFDNQIEKDEAMAKLFTIADSLNQFDVVLVIKESSRLHDREIRLSSGWKIKIGRGFDLYQRPDDWLQIGALDLDLRPCLETNVDVVWVEGLKRRTGAA
jgi:ATP-dependent Lon protease